MPGINQISRLFAVALIIIFGQSAPILAADAGTIFRDDVNGFEVLQLPTWKMDAPSYLSDSRDRVVVRFRSPDSITTGESCAVIIMETPETQHISQAALSRAVRDENFESSQLAEMQRSDPLARIISSRITDSNGVTEVETVADLHSTTKTGRKLEIMERIFSIMTPARTYSLSCAANQNVYAEKQNEFDEIVPTFKLTKK